MRGLCISNAKLPSYWEKCCSHSWPSCQHSCHLRTDWLSGVFFRLILPANCVPPSSFHTGFYTVSPCSLYNPPGWHLISTLFPCCYNVCHFLILSSLPNPLSPSLVLSVSTPDPTILSHRRFSLSSVELFLRVRTYLLVSKFVGLCPCMVCSSRQETCFLYACTTPSTRST